MMDRKTEQERPEIGSRRRYVEPAVDETQPFETLALACASTGGETPECVVNPGNS